MMLPVLAVDVPASERSVSARDCLSEKNASHQESSCLQLVKKLLDIVGLTSSNTRACQGARPPDPDPGSERIRRRMATRRVGERRRKNDPNTSGAGISFVASPAAAATA